jgi:hypothetical protein
MANFIVMKIFSGLQLIVFVMFAYLNLQFKIHQPFSLYTSDSILGHLEVKDLMIQGDSVRVLKINDIVQSEMSLSSERSVSDYVKLIDSIVSPAGNGEQALVLGLGAGLTASDLQRKGYAVEGIEFDGRIIHCAKAFFKLPGAIAAVESDARVFLNGANKKYKLLMFDLYKAEEQPSHVITSESLNKIKSLLADDGLIIMSWHGYLHSNIGRGSRILLNTIRRSGLETRVCATSPHEQFRNLIFVAGRHLENRLPHQLDEPIEEENLVNTDHRPVLERYNAEANKAWRSNYLRYYQGLNY